MRISAHRPDILREGVRRSMTGGLLAHEHWRYASLSNQTRRSVTTERSMSYRSISPLSACSARSWTSFARRATGLVSPGGGGERADGRVPKVPHATQSYQAYLVLSRSRRHPGSPTLAAISARSSGATGGRAGRRIADDGRPLCPDLSAMGALRRTCGRARPQRMRHRLRFRQGRFPPRKARQDRWLLLRIQTRYRTRTSSWGRRDATSLPRVLPAARNRVTSSGLARWPRRPASGGSVILYWSTDSNGDLLPYREPCSSQPTPRSEVPGASSAWLTERPVWEIRARHRGRSSSASRRTRRCWNASSHATGYTCRATTRGSGHLASIRFRTPRRRHATCLTRSGRRYSSRPRTMRMP